MRAPMRFDPYAAYHYLIVLPTARLVVRHRRGTDGAIETSSHDGNGTVVLDPPGLTLELATLFPP